MLYVVVNLVVNIVLVLYFLLGQDNKVPCGKYCGGHIIQSAWRIVYPLFSRGGEWCI